LKSDKLLSNRSCILLYRSCDRKKSWQCKHNKRGKLCYLWGRWRGQPIKFNDLNITIGKNRLLIWC